MAGRKLTELTTTKSLANEDLVYVVDQSAATNAKSKGIRRDDLGNTLNIGSGNASRIISGGMEWETGLTWGSVNLVYEINGVQHEITDGTQVTLDAADATNPRIDVIYGDDTGALGKKTGTAAGSPSKPSIEEWQLELTFATVAALATTPTGISNTDVYLENAGQPAEWDATESTGAARIDLANTTSPITSATDIKTLSNLTSGDYVQLTHSTAINVNQFKFLRFNIKLPAAWNRDFLTITLRDGSTVIGRARSGGFVDPDILTTQEITIFYYEFGAISGTTFDTIRIAGRSRGQLQYQIDDIIIQADTNLPPAPTTVTAADVETDVTNFGTNLSSTDTDVQKALDTIDDLALGAATSLSTGTVTATTYGITSDGGADDVVLVEADTNDAGLLGADKWDEIVANTAKTGVTTEISNVVEDTTPQLGGSLDTNAKSVEWSKGADVASATELLLLRDGNYFDITGTTAITSIETTADAWKVGSIAILQFDGILTFTHHATDLILPGGANITTAAGDVAIMQKVAAGDWKCISYNKADGTSVAGGGGGMSDLVDDTTPQLGGALDANTFAMVAADHGTATDPEVVNVVYGTGSPPAAATTTIGTLFIQYTA